MSTRTVRGIAVDHRILKALVDGAMTSINSLTCANCGASVFSGVSHSCHGRECQSCGMLLHDAGEFHPHAFCVWKQAGLDPWRQLAWIEEHLGRAPLPKR